jgi:hypothetical protein
MALFSQISAFMIFNFFSHISATKMMFWAVARVSFRAAKIVSCNKKKKNHGLRSKLPQLFYFISVLFFRTLYYLSFLLHIHVPLKSAHTSWGSPLGLKGLFSISNSWRCTVGWLSSKMFNSLIFSMFFLLKKRFGGILFLFWNDFFWKILCHMCAK